MILWQNNFKLKFGERRTVEVSFNNFAHKLFCLLVLVAARLHREYTKKTGEKKVCAAG